VHGLHSSETRRPVYARVAPGSWLIERDIVEARKHMDLSRWQQMPVEQQQVLAAKIVQEAKSGDMPRLHYLALHWNSKLSKADVQTLSILGKSAGGSEATLNGDGDAVRGKSVFEKRCTNCDAMEADRRGRGWQECLVRKQAVLRDYLFRGLENSGVTWNDATLEKWLSDPDVIGTS
jgi:cytochrome c